jgi:hypothetical protein
MVTYAVPLLAAIIPAQVRFSADALAIVNLFSRTYLNGYLNASCHCVDKKNVNPKAFDAFQMMIGRIAMHMSKTAFAIMLLEHVEILLTAYLDKTRGRRPTLTKPGEIPERFAKFCAWWLDLDFVKEQASLAYISSRNAAVARTYALYDLNAACALALGITEEELHRALALCRGTLLEKCDRRRREVDLSACEIFEKLCISDGRGVPRRRRDLARRAPAT